MAHTDEEVQLALALSGEAATRRKGRYTKKMRAFEAGHLGGSVFQGNQIRLPAIVMSEIFNDNPDGEHVYQVRTVRDRIAFVGVKDYTSPDVGRCVLPHTVMRQLEIQDNSAVELTLVNATSMVLALYQLPVATQLKLRWEDSNQYDVAWALGDAEVFAIQNSLEAALNLNFPVVKLNDMVCFQHSGVYYDMRIVALQKRACSDPTEDDSSNDVAVSDPNEVLRLRVPTWEAFDRKLHIEPPQDWIPPKPFPDAVWDASHRMYYPAGWEWDDTKLEYAPPVLQAPPVAQKARSKKGEETHNFGVGQALGTADVNTEQRVLTAEELRQQRLRAMEERMARLRDAPTATSTDIAEASKSTAPIPGPVLQGKRLRMSIEDLRVRSFQVGGREGWRAMRDISVEVEGSALFNYFKLFQKSGWMCKWALLYGSVCSKEPESEGLPKSVVCIQAIWEPPQHASDEAFGSNECGLGKPPRLISAPDVYAAVETAAQTAGLSQVGWLLTCPPRAEDFTLRAEEILHAAYLQVEQAQGYSDGEPPFVTLRMSVKNLPVDKAESSEGTRQGEILEPEITAWCATQQAMEMRAKGFFETRLGAGTYRDAAKVADGFRVIQEGHETQHVDVTFLHRPLAIRSSSDVGLEIDFETVAAAVWKPGTEKEIEYEQVTRWAPSEIRSQFQFLGEGCRLGGSNEKQSISDEPMPSILQPVIRKTMSGRMLAECERNVDKGLELIKSADIQVQRDCCSTLLKLFDNVVAQPEDPKFRRLKRSNKLLESKVFSVQGAENVLLASGWILEGDAYTLPVEAGPPLIDFVASRLREHSRHLGAGPPIDVDTTARTNNELVMPDCVMLMEWSCLQCTLINPGARVTCDACGSAKI